MLESICKIIKSYTGDKIENFIELATMVHAGEKRFPAVFDTKGQLVPINIDNKAGTCYLRLYDNVSCTDSSLKTIGNTSKEYKYPIKLVGYVKNSEFGRDDKYTSDAVCRSIIKNIQSIKRMGAQIPARLAYIDIQKYSTNMSEVLAGEYDGVEQFKRGVNFEYSVFSIDMIVTAIGSECYNPCVPYCAATE